MIKFIKMKKNIPLKLIFACSLLVLTIYSHAQVGIGTSSVNASAKLQIDASNKGFLPPRVGLTGTTDVSTIASPATALLIYNFATAGTAPNNVTPGYYYYDGTKWVPFRQTATFGSAYLAATANVAVDGTTNLASITLPTTGTYLINSTMRVTSNAAVGLQSAVGFLSETTAPGTPLIGSEINGAYVGSGASFITGGNFAGTFLYTCTSAPRTIYFVGKAIIGAMDFFSTGNGRTSINYVKVGD
jgi:hypothetical protein